MLTCYDFQTAQMLDETGVDLLLVGDSLGNVILGLDTTLAVSIAEMKIFSSAVAKGAPNKFVVADMPFGSYATVEWALKNAIELMQSSTIQAIKVEGAGETTLAAIERLIETGIPVMGHIGLTPQSVFQLGGHYIHGKHEAEADRLIAQAQALQAKGVFAIVLECVFPEVATRITNELSIPTIGIGSGEQTDGQVLVINDLFKNGRERPPKFCTPIANLYDLKKDLIQQYLNSLPASKEQQPTAPLC
jgi:3-methyl-2-oxobutanoate hydroxymethyltransferase